MNKIFKVTILTLIVITIAMNQGRAQGTPPAGPGDASGPWTSNTNSGGGDGAVPFDGGLSLILLAAGAGVGARKREKQPVIKY